MDDKSMSALIDLASKITNFVGSNKCMEEYNKHKIQYLHVFVAFGLGAGIVYWLYKDFDFSGVWKLLKYQTKWIWMFASLLFGVLSHVARGLRWRISLEPMGEFPKRRNCINAIFISYLSNMIIPRVGELSRCMVLSMYDKISFSKSLGSVVAERFVDTICICTLTLITVVMFAPMFGEFFRQTGFNISFSSIKMMLVVSAAIVVLGILAFLIVRKFAIMGKVKSIAKNMWEGFVALKNMKSKSWLYLFYTASIWLCYFLHFYLTFYCFGFTENLGLSAGMVLFIVGSVAVVVPTPNGAGPWHLAVITMMILYGINEADARIFALIVHTIQTFLVILLGIYGFLALPLSNKNQEK